VCYLYPFFKTVFMVWSSTNLVDGAHFIMEDGALTKMPISKLGCCSMSDYWGF